MVTHEIINGIITNVIFGMILLECIMLMITLYLTKKPNKYIRIVLATAIILAIFINTLSVLFVN